VEVESVPGDQAGLGWRTRMRFSVNEDGTVGMRGHRSHEVIPIVRCAIAHPGVTALDVGEKRWPRIAAIDVAVGDRTDGSTNVSPSQALVVVEPVDRDSAVPRAKLPPLSAPASVVERNSKGLRRIHGRTWLNETVRIGHQTRRFRVTGAGFWQVHPGAAQVLLDAVLAGVQARPGETAMDLYSGAGLFTAGLAAAVGPQGKVVSIESDPRACSDARRNLHTEPWVDLRQGSVRRVLSRAKDGSSGSGLARADVVVLDPPRSGAGREVTALIAGLHPRAIGYVACDPAALARDVAFLGEYGYQLRSLRAFDAFPMTHHVECLAVLHPASER
jgi:tRNA/tmRNA/rRNA uracil-C5-methylase (TrmA/RlmC/RlmD family)